MNRNIQQIILVTCPKCGKKSTMNLDVLTTVDLNGSHNIKGRYTPKYSCNCEELKKEFDIVYKKIQV